MSREIFRELTVTFAVALTLSVNACDFDIDGVNREFKKKVWLEETKGDLKELDKTGTCSGLAFNRMQVIAGSEGEASVPVRNIPSEKEEVIGRIYTGTEIIKVVYKPGFPNEGDALSMWGAFECSSIQDKGLAIDGEKKDICVVPSQNLKVIER